MTLKLPSLWPVLALAVGLLGLHCYRDAVGDAAVQRAQAKQWERTASNYRQAVIAIGSRIPKVDTVRLHDAGNAAAWEARWRRLVDSLRHAPDVGALPPIILTADSAVTSCTRALRSCEAAVAIRDTALAKRDTLEWAQDSLIAALKRKKPFLLRVGKPLAPFLLGVGAGLLLTR